MGFDATSVYPSAIWDEKLIHPKFQTGCAFTLHMNDEIVKKINTETFPQGSAILNVL